MTQSEARWNDSPRPKSSPAGARIKRRELFERAFDYNWGGPVRVLARLEAGRSAERLGARERAVDTYHFVLDIWRHGRD